MIPYVLFLVVCLLLAVLVWRRQRHFSIFKDLGIPGPTPSFLWGNLPEMEKKGIGPCMLEWSKKYGEIYGIFIGYRPVVMCENRDAIQSVLIKNSLRFNRQIFFEVFDIEDARLSSSLAAVKGQKWKDFRGILSPTFSGSKLRQVVPIINERLDEFLDQLASLPRDQEVDFLSLYSPLMVDMSFSVFTGLQLNVFKNPSQKIVKALKNFLSVSLNDSTQKFQMSFPHLLTLMAFLERFLPFRLFSTGHLTYLFDSTGQVIQRRTQMSDFSRKDLLQLMIDHNKEVEKLNGKTASSKDILNDVEISANAVNFIFAGYETSKLLMSYTTHMLIHHPDIQEKVREEILNVVGDKKEVSYGDLKELRLLDRVLSETLRLHPPTLTAISREAEGDYEVMGKTIPKDVNFMVPLTVLHLSSKYWKEPLVFDPDRFLPERKVDPLVYMPFGAGPRFCIGKKMALTVTMLAMARMLQQYRILPGPRTEQEDLPKEDTLFIVNPKNAVFGKLARI